MFSDNCEVLNPLSDICEEPLTVPVGKFVTILETVITSDSEPNFPNFQKSFEESHNKEPLTVESPVASFTKIPPVV